ncbi:MAG: TIGR03013 family PEP-CTERM/XrtA system glycosyltransferase [Acidobacteria bacterium]|nr:TIGR03013 family PEP-CTERM/XrtA system glycosyltransferase [Acidobacteriota bacterium]MCW5971117.1 TIGR03013 family PEP-CTERM/XrtA system glycosyltransferase [Blastocatellales bacterium]
MVRRGFRLKTLSIAAVEAGILCAVILLGLYVRFAPHHELVFFEQRGIYKVAGTIAVCQFIFYLFDLYDITAPRTHRELVLHLLQATGAIVLTLGAAFALRPTLLLGYMQEIEGVGVVRYGNWVPLFALALALGLMICWRVLIHWLFRRPWLGERILIVGTGPSAAELAHEAIERRDLGFQVVGFVAEDAAMVGQSIVNPGVIGVVGDLTRLVESERIDRVVVALQDRRGHMPVDQLFELRLQGRVAIEEGTSLYERLTGKVGVELLRPSWIIFSGNTRRGALWMAARRVFHFIVALAGLLISLPLWPLIAIAIRLDSRGPVFYRQERVGKQGRLFNIIKFRSMREDAESNGPAWSAENDPRTTRVGRLLRKFRLDELPQFINILRGEMSLVGPRAERPYFVAQLSEKIPFYAQRHLVEPGLTGWAQVMYGYGASIEDAQQKLQYDLYYIKNVSLWFDLWIVIKSMRIVLFGRGR